MEEAIKYERIVKNEEGVSPLETAAIVIVLLTLLPLLVLATLVSLAILQGARRAVKLTVNYIKRHTT